MHGLIYQHIIQVSQPKYNVAEGARSCNFQTFKSQRNMITTLIHFTPQKKKKIGTIFVLNLALIRIIWCYAHF